MSSHKHGCPKYQDNSSFLWIKSKQRDKNLLEKETHKLQIWILPHFRDFKFVVWHCILSEMLKVDSTDFSKSHLCCAVLKVFYDFTWQHVNRDWALELPSPLHKMHFFNNAGPNKSECKKDIKERLEMHGNCPDRCQRKNKLQGKNSHILPTSGLRN